MSHSFRQAWPIICTSLFLLYQTFRFALKTQRSCLHVHNAHIGGFDNREGGANYRKLFKLALEDLFKSASDESVQAILKFERDQVLTTVSIAVELAALGIHQDSTATTALLSNENEDCRITIAAGYLNLPTTYQSLILNSKNKIDILTGSPEANGFFNSQGVSRHIPAAYSYLQLLFQTDVRQAGREMCIKVYEYFRKGWTWHAKGLWIVPNNPRNPYTTAIGSSNFNYRSLERDLETQLFIRTKCPTLISQFEAVY